jgi:hypothetical protein
LASPALKEVTKETPKNFRRYLEDGNPIYDQENPKYSIDKTTRQVIDYKTKLKLEKTRPQTSHYGDNSPKSQISKSVVSQKSIDHSSKKSQKNFEVTP